MFSVKFVSENSQIYDKPYTHISRLRANSQIANMFVYCSLGCPEQIVIGGLLSSRKSHRILNPYNMLPDYKACAGALSAQITVLIILLRGLICCNLWAYSNSFFFVQIHIFMLNLTFYINSGEINNARETAFMHATLKYSE